MSDATDRDAELAAAYEALDDLRDSLDRALVASESASRAKHAEANRAQKLLALLERAIKALRRAGAADVAAELNGQLGVAMEQRT
jgi:hypothetical protein